MNHTDPVLETLFLPFIEGAIALSDRALFLRARDGAPLRKFATTHFTCQQTFKPHAEALERAGFNVDNSVQTDTYPLVAVLPPRQREESRALLARAVDSAKGGLVIACAANDEGAKSHEDDLGKLAGSVSVMSKHKCRVFWASIARQHAPILKEWLALDVPRPICDGKYMSRPGVFAWDRVDAASALLAKHLPNDLKGRAADLGAGFGYLSIELLSRCPAVNALDLYEAEQRALDLARLNLETASSKAFSTRQLNYCWHDVTAGLTSMYDVIVMNPPFHAQGSGDRPDIGRRFIAAAAQSLAPNGRLWLVANRHLPYESVLDANFGKVRIVAQEHGFKVIEAIRAAGRR
jgi:16S rRNA (guanine1207-N2)-methyltransferase